MSKVDFEKTLEWVEQEEELRKTRGQGISTGYLVISCVMVLGLMLFIYYLINRDNSNFEALDMMKDPENMYDDDFSLENGDDGMDGLEYEEGEVYDLADYDEEG